MGESAGEFADTTFSSNVTDIVYGAKHLREHFQAPRLLIGHSLGGAAVIVAASLIPEVEAVATIAAPSYPAHVSHLFEEHMEKLEKEGSIIVHIAGRDLQIKKEFIDDIKSHNLEGILKNLRKALIIFHSPIDQIVSIEHARKLYNAAHHPKSFISIDKGDHLLSRKEDAEFVATILGAWAKRYISS